MMIIGSVPQVVTVVRMTKWMQSIGVPEFYAARMAVAYQSVGSGYGVRWDWALFQAIHETNMFKFGGDVDASQNNFAGIGAVGGGAKGESFPTIDDGVKAHIQHLATYAGAVIPITELVAERTKTVAVWIRGQAQTFEDLTGKWATDPQYFMKVNGWAKRFETWLSQVLADEGDAGFWVDEFVTPGTVCVMRGSALVKSFQVGNSVQAKAAAYAEAREIGAGTFAIAPAGKPIPSQPAMPTRQKKRVLIDPGHSEKRTGARGRNPYVQEEDVNRFQAACLKQQLAKFDIEGHIIDPLDDDLLGIGRAAKGFDAFVSLHLNASSRREFYTCAMVHKSLQSGSSLSAQVASAWAKAVAEAINNPLFAGSAGYPKGVMASGLSVLRGAVEANCPIAFLSEAEFIDDETEDGPLLRRMEKAMTAGAKVMAAALLD